MLLLKRDAQFRQINASSTDEDNINAITGDQNSSSVNEVDQDLFLNNKKEDQEQNDSVGQYRKEQDKKDEDI
ncbi:MAG: hypothetical protein EZS28_015232 [Streblomastix strix]|uniref:Uncharacterized protein n=1 Tax=Streblomastix strix TaxID=222440 RepID=A0A5J4W3F9_9EUKA|nr:MAG: hypothetical protein EZS28_015232 [Streblomastix strix]